MLDRLRDRFDDHHGGNGQQPPRQPGIFIDGYGRPRMMRIASAAFAALMTATAAYDSFFIVPETSRGLIYNMGKLAAKDPSDLRRPGLNFKLPFVQSAKLMPVSLQQINLEKENIYTKDSQDLDANIQITYTLPEDKLVDIARNNPNYGPVLIQTVRQALKDSFGRTEATDIPSTRNILMKDSTDNARKLVSDQLGIRIQNITMPNFEYNNAFKAAVVRATQMKAEAERSRQEVEKTKAEAESKREAARGSADAVKIAADADLHRAQKEAEGFRALTGAIGEKNLPAYWNSQKWDGKLPTVNGGVLPMMDVGKVAGGSPAPAPAPAPAPGR
jgi:regulator of protease activity HflC (stomatin/prohibitin superfamily)